MKVVKILLKAILWIVAIVLVALLALPLWFGPVGKTVANLVVPSVVKTGFHIERLSLNPYTARFELNRLKLSNPAGYKEEYAVKVGEAVCDVETLSLVGDVLHFEEIRLKDIFGSYVKGGSEKVDNFKQIQYNMAGGREKYEAEKARKKAAKAAAPEENDDGPSKKIVIDRLEISGVEVQYGHLPIKVPVDIILKDIGRESDGLTLEELWELIWKSVLESAGIVGDQLKVLDEAAKDLGKNAKEIGSAAMNLGKATGTLSKSTVKGVGSVVKDVGKGLKADKGAKAVGDSAKKALDSLKGLW